MTEEPRPLTRFKPLLYLALGVALFAVVFGWDYVGLRLWGKN